MNNNGVNTSGWKVLRGRFQAQLDEFHYQEGTIKFYMRWLDRIEQFLKEHGLSEYTQETGTAFLAENVENTDMAAKTVRMIRIVVRRLDELLRNDCFNINRQTEDILTLCRKQQQPCLFRTACEYA